MKSPFRIAQTYKPNQYSKTDPVFIPKPEEHFDMHRFLSEEITDRMVWYVGVVDNEFYTNTLIRGKDIIKFIKTSKQKYSVYVFPNNYWIATPNVINDWLRLSPNKPFLEFYETYKNKSLLQINFKTIHGV